MNVPEPIEKEVQNGEITTTVEDSAVDVPHDEPYTIFSRRQKGLIVCLAAGAATNSGIMSNIYFPVLPQIADAFNVSIELIDLTVTAYLLFQGLAPSFWGPISDVKGRRTAYCITFIIIVAANIGLALSPNYAALIVLRCLQSTGSASTIAIGGGVIGDITTRADRGGYMGIYQAGGLVPSAVGPVIGGAIGGALGWRAIFWFLVIYSGSFLMILLFLLPETLRSIVSNGSRTPGNIFQRYPLVLYQKMTKVQWSKTTTPPPAAKHINVFKPLRIIFSKFAAPIILCMAISFAIWQMSITAMSSLFTERYGLSETQNGLTFLANGAGSILGTWINGVILDKEYRRAKARDERAALENHIDGNDDATIVETQATSLEKVRLRFIPIYGAMQCASLLLFGWTIQYTVHISVPIIASFFNAWACIAILATTTTYLVDVFPNDGAAATASVNLARCLLGAGGTTFIVPMIDAIGVGLAFTVCGIVLAGFVAGLFIQFRYSARWRVEAEAKREKKG